MKALLRPALLALALTAGLATDAEAQSRDSLSHYNLEKKSLALSGYDPVAYFEVGGGKPKKGKKSLTAEHRGVVYRFASSDNRAQFLSDPMRFEPAYGGWCAFAMADGEKVEVDPESFLVQDGQLHVFYDGLFANTRKSWQKKPAKLKVDADANWEKIAKESPARSQVNLDDTGLILGGYDAVSYFEKKKPEEGSERFETTWRGARYRFSSDKRRAEFVSNPERYAPAFGGFCAYAVAKGQLYGADPLAYEIQDDRLLVFYRQGDTDTRQSWGEDAQGNLKLADANWPKVGAAAN